MGEDRRVDEATGGLGSVSSDGVGWRVVLRAERRRLGVTQAQLAARAGISTDTLRKYENGDRTPSRGSLEQVLAALGVPQSTASRVRRDLGLALPETVWGSGSDYYFTVPQARAFIRDSRWPQFVTNDIAEIVAANGAAEALWGVNFEEEFARRSRAQVNFLAIAAERRFSQRIVNWEPLVGRLVSVLKAIPQSAKLLDDPSSLFGDVFAAFARNDPTAIPKLFALWERTPPATAKTRWDYPVIWREPGFDDVQFEGIVTTASEPDGLAFNDWIPVDAASHATLERIIAARADPPTAPTRHDPAARPRRPPSDRRRG